MTRTPLLAILFALGSLLYCAEASAAPVKVVEQEPASVVTLADGSCLLDFQKAAFGNLLLTPQPGLGNKVTVEFGEALRDGRVDRTPPGTVRYARVEANLEGGAQIVAPPADARNTRPPAVLTPPSLGVLLPFRWVEISGWPCTFKSGAVRRRAVFDSTWNDAAASFHSSDPMLDRIWQLSHDSIRATTFAGIFVDGDRERLAYEADAYLNQLGYYAGNPDSRMERDTFERLMKYPTWPSEWAPHMIFIAYADWMQTGDKAWLSSHYDWLKTRLLLDRLAGDGLIHSDAEQMRHTDIVDWPVGERDGFVFTPINTVVNAFYLRAVAEMAQLATACDRPQDAAEFTQRRNQGLAAFQQTLLDSETGLFRDGIGTNHSSVHANLFPLAFGLVPAGKRSHIAAWLAAQGMRNSVYAAQYQMEGLFENDQATAALDLMTAPGDRSWRHMVESGATITWEAWDQRYKPNQDWNHAWGAAPANLLPRFVLGVQVAEPGWRVAEIAPHPGDLGFAAGTVPTPLGSIEVAWKQQPHFSLTATLPERMTARIRLPAAAASRGIWQEGRPKAAHREGEWWVLDSLVRGTVHLEVR